MAIDRKPENGCEIQTAACGRSGIMIRMKLVKTKEGEAESHQDADSGLNHGPVVIKELTSPWVYSGRIVCADSYFASVSTAKELKRIGLRFIEVVKTATRGYPMKALGEVELTHRGDRRGLVPVDPAGDANLLAFVWLDRERRYLIATCSSLEPGTAHFRERWRQIQPIESNEEP